MRNTELTDGSDLRRRILDATRHLLVEDGYANLSMRRIAQEIGYSATTIYLHFESKGSLFDTLVEEGMDRLYHALSSARIASDDAVTQLRRICRSYIDFGLDNPEYYEVMFVTRPSTPYRFPSEKYRRARRNLDLIADTLQTGLDDGTMDVPDVRVGASSIWTSLHGVVSLWIAKRIDRRIDCEKLIEASIRQIVTGYRKSVPA
jgi:AcrR family transcriptional regulator